MNEKDNEYLVTLTKTAQAKIKEKYDLDVKKPKIDPNKTLEENKAFIIQAIKNERDLKLKDKPKVATSVTSRTSKEQKEKEARAKAKIEQEAIQKMKVEEEKTINEWKKQFNPSMIVKLLNPLHTISIYFSISK